MTTSSIKFGGVTLVMNKKISKSISVVVCLSIFLSFFCCNIVYAQNAGLNIIEAKNNVEKNKSWIINFSVELQPDTVNPNNIMVINENGQPVGTNIVLLPNNKSVKVSPISDYVYGKTYYLKVNNQVKSSFGNDIEQPIKMQFTIKNNPNGNNNSSNTNNNTKNSFKICLDAGQGGPDAGVIGPGGLKEKDLTLAVALKTGKILEQNKIEVVYTRKDDNISWPKDYMEPRFKIANDQKVDFYLTIHGNLTTDNPKATGTETYYIDGDTRGKEMSDIVQQEMFKNTKLLNRGAKTGNPLEIKGLSVPAAKVVLGFLSTPEEEQKLKDSNFQESCAKAIANAVLKYKETNSSGPRIVSTEESIITVVEGGNYILPNKVKAKMNDDTVQELPVVWNNSGIDISKPGTYACEGIITGYTKKTMATVLVLSKNDSRYSVVLDAGHGGYDSGTVGITGSLEKDLTLCVTLKTGKILEENGVRVIYTRTSDKVSWPSEEMADLLKRCEISNAVKPNYFVAIHINSFNNHMVNGTETHHSKESVAGERLASLVQNQLIETLGSVNRGLKISGFVVLEKTDSPSILTELGFSSNSEEEAKLKSPEYQQKCAEAIAKGILQALGK